MKKYRISNEAKDGLNFSCKAELIDELKCREMAYKTEAIEYLEVSAMEGSLQELDDLITSLALMRNEELEKKRSENRAKTFRTEVIGAPKPTKGSSTCALL